MELAAEVRLITVAGAKSQIGPGRAFAD